MFLVLDKAQRFEWFRRDTTILESLPASVGMEECPSIRSDSCKGYGEGLADDDSFGCSLAQEQPQKAEAVVHHHRRRASEVGEVPIAEEAEGRQTLTFLFQNTGRSILRQFRVWF